MVEGIQAELGEPSSCLLSAVRGSLPVCFQHVCTAEAEIWHSVVVFVEISLFLQSWRTVFSLGQNCDLQKWVWRGGILHPWAAGCRCALGNSNSEDSFVSNLALLRYVKWWSTDIILPPSTVFPCYHFLYQNAWERKRFSCPFFLLLSSSPLLVNGLVQENKVVTA